MSDMSVASAVGSTQSTQQSPWAQRKNLFDQLGQALQKGDLKAAQTAFAALQQNAPQGPPPTQDGQGNGAQSRFTALADALQKGDLAGAQQAFSQIQQARGQHHHHHRTEASSSPATASAASATTSSNSTATTTASAAGSKADDKDGDKDKPGARVDLIA
jgi:outer membrane protein assembly factor BamD (BamD/ComL family)